jgi:hypothetical protein
MPIPRLLAAIGSLALSLAAVEAAALTVLNVGKQVVFDASRGRVRVAKDTGLAPLGNPLCGGDETRVQVASYPVATSRLVAQDEVVLPCERWRPLGKGFVYEDDGGAAGGVVKVAYSARKLVIELGGTAYQPLSGPVGYAELWFRVGTARILVRVHDFARNDAGQVVSRKPSKVAARGETLFWEVLHGTDKSEPHMQKALATLRKAAKKSKKDGRAPFLLGMMHLYRYGLFLDQRGRPTDAARSEIAAANEAFAMAGPRLWDGTVGDSRVPGFIAAAKFAEGYARGDDALMNEGIAEVHAAVDLNPFFNVFDLIPVIQALPPSDPRWQDAYADVVAYLEDPDTLACLGTQPEICANAGLAPHNTGGALVLFGDVYAKAGDATQATTWYTFAASIGGTPDDPWAFQPLAEARLADVEGRVARYLDADPENDDPVVGIGEENCAVCHNR